MIGSRHTRYIIEARTPGGKLDLTPPQPEDIFGYGAIRGMSDDAIAKAVFRHCGTDLILTGADLLQWASHIDPRFHTRVKTW